MIDWDIVEAYFRLYLSEFESDRSLKDYFLYFYEEEKLSWRKIAEITEGYVSDITLLNKARSFGMKIRPRGGPRHGPNPQLLQMPEDEYYALTDRELAKKYGVHRCTIAKYGKILKFRPKPRGRPKETFESQDESGGIYQE